ncbi:hypothetical protein NE237_021390 [Protea cynaroides]|uniref:Uncharacterized protein n=1 Tax=Protea cynaroides TaxID=273540 RepID=A0A9Q0HB71_9MAGN|nr:hypothetical protein NE237_021390 [Protea cynaroides]
MMGEEQQKVKVLSPSESEEMEELQKLELFRPMWKSKKRLSKQLSMCEKPRDAAWEKRRYQILRRNKGFEESDAGIIGLTDEDLCELKGSIELGFGFNEEDGQSLCNTLPALDLYFAVNRRLSSASCSPLDNAGYKHRGYSPSPVSTPMGSAKSPSSSSGSPRSESDSWKICNPGDKPQHVKTKLRHWAQAVACSSIAARQKEAKEFRANADTAFKALEDGRKIHADLKKAHEAPDEVQVLKTTNEALVMSSQAT